MSLRAWFISAAVPAIDGDRLRRLAEMAAAGGLDFLVIEPPGDALIAASWLLPRTRWLGIVAKVSALYAQPFHVARAFSAMDTLSGGRTGWMPSLSGGASQAENFGNLPMMSPNAARCRAAEMVEACRALWDSWDPDALIIDKPSARYLDSEKIRRIEFRGEHLQVMGPLNAVRPPQGHPLLVLDAQDDAFESLKKWADVIIISATGASASTIRQGSAAHVLVKVRCHFSANLRAAACEFGESLTLTGSATQIADFLIEWQRSTPSDGFHLIPGQPEFGGGDAILREVVPVLRQRGAAFAAASANTLRARLGISVPVNPWSVAK